MFWRVLSTRFLLFLLIENCIDPSLKVDTDIKKFYYNAEHKELTLWTILSIVIEMQKRQFGNIISGFFGRRIPNKFS